AAPLIGHSQLPPQPAQPAHALPPPRRHHRARLLAPTRPLPVLPLQLRPALRHALAAAPARRRRRAPPLRAGHAVVEGAAGARGGARAAALHAAVGRRGGECCAEDVCGCVFADARRCGCVGGCAGGGAEGAVDACGGICGGGAGRAEWEGGGWVG
ncbi:hypothetical protein BKA80DRAFT_346158, partial [Phyllosticta citrichinensis]